MQTLTIVCAAFSARAGVRAPSMASSRVRMEDIAPVSPPTPPPPPRPIPSKALPFTTAPPLLDGTLAGVYTRVEGGETTARALTRWCPSPCDAWRTR